MTAGRLIRIAVVVLAIWVALVVIGFWMFNAGDTVPGSGEGIPFRR
jgi:hypothetical protein